MKFFRFLSLATTLLYSSSAFSFEGTYEIESGLSPTSVRYSGTVTIHRAGPGFLVGWRLSDQSEYRGYGFEVDGRLAVAYGVEDTAGIVAYTIGKDLLSGTWAGAGASRSTERLGVELLDLGPGIEGEHPIVKGMNQDGSPYSGTVSIAQTGEVYTFTWRTGGESSFGTGLRVGPVLAAVFGVGAGVVVYEKEADILRGKWTTMKGAKVGSETLRLISR